MARLLADDAVHPAVHPVGEGQLHRGGDEPRDAAAAVRAPADERALLHTECLSSVHALKNQIPKKNSYLQAWWFKIPS